MDVAETSEKRSGRLERRRLQASTPLAEKSDWPDLAQVCRLVRTTRRGDEETTEINYAVTSVPRKQADAATLDEDACRIRKGNAPQVLAALRNGVVSMLRLEGHVNIASALRACTWKTHDMLTRLRILKE